MAITSAEQDNYIQGFSSDVANQIKELNKVALTLYSTIARRDLNASVTLGVSQDVVEALKEITPLGIHKLANCGVLIAKVRFNDSKFWESVTDGTIDHNNIITKVLQEA